MQIPAKYRICTAQQCQTMDKKTIEEFGINGFTLMEVAGTRAAEFIRAKTTAGQHALFLCGKGNNAGDALVVARLLGDVGYKISIYFVQGSDQLSPDTARNYGLLQKMGWELEVIGEIGQLDEQKFDFVVDGMLGTGLKSKIRAPYLEIVEWVNKSGKTVFAMDVPTGLNADNGMVMAAAIKANYTTAFGALKPGFYLNSGPKMAGEIVLCEIPVPNKYKNDDLILIDEEWVQANLVEPPQRSHKYEQGILYIVAGSEGLTGAAILSAKSAWKTGLGAVVLITPKALMPVYDKNLVQIIKKSVGEKEDAFFKKDHLDEVLGILKEKKGSLLIGPGLGREADTVDFVQELLKQYHGNAVIDADALYALSRITLNIKPKNSEWILTPHAGEFNRLFDVEIEDGAAKIEECRKMATKNDITIMAKGMPGIIAGTNGQVFISDYDTKIFNRAGFGDVLAGKTGAFFLKYKNPILSTAMAMLDGNKKAIVKLKEKDEPLEPIDIL